MAIITTYPRSRAMNERIIRRTQENFDRGMLRPLDTEGTDVGNNALADLINGRCKQHSVEGRPGSQLWTPAQYGIFIGTTVETLSESMQSGLLYQAAGNTVPSVGDIFMTYDEHDFANSALTIAKGSAPRKWDCWYVENNTVGNEAVKYLGNIRIPPVPGYGDTDATEFTASKSGNTITIISGPTLPTDGSLTGYYFAWNDGNRDIIDDIPTGTTITTRYSGTVDESAYSVIQPPINGSLYHKAAHQLICHFGRRIYVSTQMPFAGWREIPGAVSEKVSNAPSYIYEFDDDAILFTNNGIYYIYLSSASGPYYWKINTSVPHKRIDDVERAGSSKHKYRYTYTYVHLATNNYTLDRFNQKDGCLLKKETGSVEPNENNVDYGERWTDEPIGPGTDTRGVLIGAQLSGEYASHSGWMGINDASFIVSVNGTLYLCTADFTAVENMKDVARILQNSIRVHKELSECVVEYDNNAFVFATGAGDVCSYAISGTTGTDVATYLGWTEAAGATVTTRTCDTPHYVETLFAPPDSNDVIAYGVYRTTDCSDESVNEHAYTWVADIPVCKALVASIDANGVLNVEIGKIEKEDEGCILYSLEGPTVKIASVDDTITVTNIDGSAYSQGALQSANWALGATNRRLFIAEQIGLVLYLFTGLGFTNEDEGKIVFWADGGYSIITKVIWDNTAICAWGATHESQAAVMEPTSRGFTDTVSDEDIISGRAASYPLQGRFRKPLPNGNIGVYAHGFIVTCNRGSNEYRYCSAAEKYLAGFHHYGLQVDSSIWDGIQSMVPVGGVGNVEPYIGIIIRGANNTYFLKMDEPIDVGNDSIGEICPQLPSPRIITRSIGTIGDGGVQPLDSGGHILITSEPAVRIHDGEKYSDINFAAGAIQNSELIKFKPNYVTAYQKRCGFFVWGKQEA